MEMALSHELRGILFDMDGVLYNGDCLICGAVDIVAWVHAQGIPHLFLTNTTSRSRAVLALKLGAFGIQASEDYLSLTPGVWKTFNTEDQTFWCCTGSGVEEYSKLNDSIYWRDREGLYVNLFGTGLASYAELGINGQS
jgi:ribonucleotide monophosphatase NagD (HAD superfamily)